MNAAALAMPWAPSSGLYSAPGSLVLKLPLGEAPAAIPATLDVRVGARAPAEQVGVGPVDRVLRQFSDRVRVVRVHAAAASLGRPGAAHTGFDDLEHALGLSRMFRVDVEPTCPIGDVVDALRQLADVESASPMYLCTLPFTASPPAPVVDEAVWTAFDRVRGAEALAYDDGDPAVVAALLDTGVAADHPELRDKLRPGLDTVQLGRRDLAAGIRLLGDLDDPDNEPADEVGHGTAAAGIVAAAGHRLPPGLGGACGLLPIRVLGSAELPGRVERFGVGSAPDINRGLKECVDLGAKIVNMSFGTPESALGPDDPDPHADTCRYALARGCILVAASGNSGRWERFTPACLDGVIAVGAADADDRPAAFSTSGEHVALAAPGERVPGAGLNGYALVTGTSFAAPFVSAAAALLASRAARRARAIDSRTAGRLLRAGARPWPAGSQSGHGAGILDALGALRALDAELDRAPFGGGGPGRAVPTGARGP
jgi:subtilisin family serine protease